MTPIPEFLILNGFKQVTECKFTNRRCMVWIHDTFYQVHFTIGDNWFDYYSDSLTIYELIGFLTYNKLMTKRYKTV